MFTGIIQSIGCLSRSENAPDGKLLWIRSDGFFENSRRGDSVSLNGVCLSIEEHDSNSAQFFASKETLARTCLNEMPTGKLVNLELALRPTSFMGGHFVQGHIDGKALLKRIHPSQKINTLELEYPSELRAYLVEKGSVCLDGVSLTVNRVSDKTFDVCIIPETWEQTNFSQLQESDFLNIEVDILAKYVERQLQLYKGAVPK